MTVIVEQLILQADGWVATVCPVCVDEILDAAIRTGCELEIYRQFKIPIVAVCQQVTAMTMPMTSIRMVEQYPIRYGLALIRNGFAACRVPPGAGLAIPEKFPALLNFSLG